MGRYGDEGHHALTLAPSALLELLQSFDVYRRPQRFEEFIMVCQMGAPEAEEGSYPQADYLRGAVEAARGVAVKPLVEAGFTGQQLGEALKAERLKALETYKELR